MREVEAQGVGADVRAFLLYMVTENLLQGVVQKVGCRMVGCAGGTLVGIDTCHEVGIWLLGQFLDNMYALVVLTLGVDDAHGLVLANQHSAVADLSSHLAIEWRDVEYKFVERVFLLGHLAVAQYVTFVFCVVVAHELLLALSQLHPVAVLYGGGIACAFLLLLHLLIKLLLVNG